METASSSIELLEVRSAPASVLTCTDIDDDTNNFDVKSLSVRSMATYGLATQGGTGDLDRRILGEVGAFTGLTDGFAMHDFEV